MSTSSSYQTPRLGRGAFIVGVLSCIPLLGIPFGIIAVIWGLATKRAGGKKLASIGFAGMICLTIVPYSALFYFGFPQRGGVYDNLRSKMAQNNLNATVQSIEFYKMTHGEYPDSMEGLKSSLPKDSLQALALYDPRIIREMEASSNNTPPRYLYYRRVGADHYHLRGLAPDGNPFSPGALVPEVIPSSTANLGLLIAPPVVNSLLTQNTQVNHAEIARHVTAVNRIFDDPIITQFWNPLTAAGRAALDAMITQQAQIIAYIDDYKLLMIATLVVIPLLIVFKRASSSDGDDHTVVMD